MKKKIIENLKTLIYALILAIIIRSFIFKPFYIPSSSMEPNLLVGDRLFVTKYSYGYSKHSFPFSPPIFSGRIIYNQPKRGDVVVFLYPCDPSIKYIKRLVGLPGDEITYNNKELTINGIKVKSKYQTVYKDPKQYGSHVYEEIIDEGNHSLLLTPSRRGREGSFSVPDGHYFFMGDNRDNSRDSRYECPGFVSRDLFVGRATRIWFNWDFSSFPEWGRIGDKIE